MRRRAFVQALACASGLLLLASPAFAGSYLDRSSYLLNGARRDAETLRSKMTDKEIARVVHAVAEARAEAASKMDVPASVAKAHPHLLLALSQIQKAAQSAVDGNYTNVLEHLTSARREETIFRNALKDLGFPLPEPKS